MSFEEWLETPIGKESSIPRLDLLGCGKGSLAERLEDAYKAGLGESKRNQKRDAWDKFMLLFLSILCIANLAYPDVANGPALTTAMTIIVIQYLIKICELIRNKL